MLDNPNPVIHTVTKAYKRPSGALDSEEIYNLLKDIKDPEHPYSLEQLKVISVDQIKINLEERTVNIKFTPTVPHCSLSTMIGLQIRAKLLENLPSFMKVFIFVEPGTHSQEFEINKQLNDKERIAAAMENQNLMNMVQNNIGLWE
ncbi:unnamed protein product [Blepharisma stoltei]|uniref:MIP18 family-like domain-containing protein n=1 Tax=Blepharisma stoltei TaxID=1481888 RepID=A0AAU9J9Y2_9CILI|nr:unnamed protein product [Blepharisma stoltei]